MLLLKQDQVFGKMFRDALGAFGPERIGQHLFGELKAAAPAARLAGELKELLQNGFLLAGRDVVQGGLMALLTDFTSSG